MYVANEGIFVSVVKENIAEAFLQQLRADENGPQAAIIGRVTTETPGKVLLQSAIGGKRVVNYMTGEQLPRIC